MIPKIAMLVYYRVRYNMHIGRRRKETNSSPRRFEKACRTLLLKDYSTLTETCTDMTHGSLQSALYPEQIFISSVK